MSDETEEAQMLEWGKNINTPRTDEKCCQATPEELCAGTLKHYEDVSMKACHWNNQVPQAIEYWFLKKPQLERELTDARAALTKADDEVIYWGKRTKQAESRIAQALAVEVPEESKKVFYYTDHSAWMNYANALEAAVREMRKILEEGK
jgi:hypothetical protein